MKKKKSGGGGANWMDTYGDMVTLLLCFFVLLYSMSTISEENWKALVMSFNPLAQDAITATKGGDGPNADDDNEGGNFPTPEPQEVQQQVEAEIEDLYQMLQQYAQQNNMSESLSVTKGDGKVFVNFNQTAFFNGNSSELRDDALPILEAVGGMLNGVRGSIDEVQILGHTAQEVPGKPNDVTVDRTLSSQRATNVLIYIQKNTELDPGRLISMGLGQWRPADTNDTAEGRANNRRVEMIVSGRNIEEELAEGVQILTTDPEKIAAATGEAEPPVPNGADETTTQPDT